MHLLGRPRQPGHVRRERSKLSRERRRNLHRGILFLRHATIRLDNPTRARLAEVQQGRHPKKIMRLF